MSDDISLMAIVVTISIIVVALGATLLGVGYADYRVDNGKQAACEDAFGPGADWVGLTTDLNGVICETPGGDLHALDKPDTEPHGTFVGFLQSIGGST